MPRTKLKLRGQGCRAREGEGGVDEERSKNPTLCRKKKYLPVYSGARMNDPAKREGLNVAPDEGVKRAGVKERSHLEK